MCVLIQTGQIWIQAHIEAALKASLIITRAVTEKHRQSLERQMVSKKQGFFKMHVCYHFASVLQLLFWLHPWNFRPSVQLWKAFFGKQPGTVCVVQGATAQAIAFIRSCGGFMAFAAMLIATKLVAMMGILNAGLAACAFHSIGVILCGMLYWLFFANGSALLQSVQGLAAQLMPWATMTGPMSTVWALWVFAMLANLARASVWVFEIIETSIFQTATPSRIMVTASAAEAAIQSMAELSLLGLAAIGLGGHNALVMISQAAALLSLLIYLWWLVIANGRAQYNASALEHSGVLVS